jgi:hypothetical protein
MRRQLDVAFSALLVATFAWGAWQARQWPENAALFPLAIALPGTALALVQLSASLRARSQPAGAPGMLADIPERERVRRSLEVVGWILAFIAAVWALGFLAAVPLASFLYLRSVREGWAESLLVPAGTWALLYFLFDRALHVPLPPGELLQLFGVE